MELLDKGFDKSNPYGDFNLYLAARFIAPGKNNDSNPGI